MPVEDVERYVDGLPGLYPGKARFVYGDFEPVPVLPLDGQQRSARRGQGARLDAPRGHDPGERRDYARIVPDDRGRVDLLVNLSELRIQLRALRARHVIARL